MSYNALKLSAGKKTGKAETYSVTVSGADRATAIAWRLAPDGRSEQAEATVLAAWYGAQNRLLGHVAQELTATRPNGSKAEAVFDLSVPLAGAKPERLRLLVRDAVSGHMGTIDIVKP